MKTSMQLNALVRNLAKEKNVGAEIILRNYMLERLLERIALSEYKENFILKGGMLIAAMVGLDARTTMDLDDFLLYNWNILRFSPPVRTDNVEERRINPKRMQREISGQLQDKGIGTKAQQALKLQHEQGKIERKIQNREQKEAEKERQYALRQEKKKAKHRGR